MPRIERTDVGGYVYHVINRANARAQIFDSDKDYQLFENILEEAAEKFGMRIYLIERMVADPIYPISFYQVWGDNSAGNYPQPNAEHLFAKRINVKPEWDAENLLAVLESSRDKTLPHYDNFIKNNGWKKTWGNVNFNGGSMVTGAHTSTTGSTVFLDGSYLWQDYKFKADVNLTKGQTFSLMARYKDGKNYAVCSYSDNSIRVEQLVNGEKEILSELKGDFVFIGKNRKVGIEVYGDIVNCYLDGKIAMKGYNLDHRLDHGGIGFKTWDPLINNSELIIKNVSVEEIRNGVSHAL